MFIFKDTEPSPLQDSFSVRQQVTVGRHEKGPGNWKSTVVDVQSLLLQYVSHGTQWQYLLIAFKLCRGMMKNFAPWSKEGPAVSCFLKKQI